MQIKKNTHKLLLTLLSIFSLVNYQALSANERQEERAPVGTRQATPVERRNVPEIGSAGQNARAPVGGHVAVASRPVPVVERPPVGRHHRSTSYEKPARRSNWGFAFGFSGGGVSTVVRRAPVGCNHVGLCDARCVRYVPVPTQRVVVVPAPTYTYYTSETAEYCHSIASIYNNGELLQLEDGSLWQIAPNALAWTQRWLRNEQIDISRTNSAHYPFQLFNRQTKEGVTAVLKAGPSTSSRIVAQDTNTIIQVVAEGELIRLADDTLWELSETGRYTTRLWRAGESIEIARSGQYTYPYLLTNRITGEVVEAKQMKAS